MASSNSYNFVVTRDQLITDALLHVGAIGEGETPSANAVTETSRVLNMIAKLRAADGMPLWAMKRGVILPVTGVSSINTTSHIVQAGSYVETTISADEAAAQTTISITSGTGMTDSDQIGIELDDQTMHWTTISSGGGTTTPVIASALPSEASAGNKVYTYTASADRIARPLRVVNANILETTNDVRYEIDLEDHKDYFNLANPTQESVPNVLYYEATLGDNDASPDSATKWYGTFHLYPRFLGGDHVIEFSYQRPFQDFDSAGDHPDFPQEFYLPLMLELAAIIGVRYQLPIEERRALFNEAEIYRMEALATVAPEGSLTMQVDARRF